MTEQRVYHYRIDFEGRIFHERSEITDSVTIRQLIARIHRDEQGRPYALCMGECMMLEPEDVIHVIQEFEDPDGAKDLARLEVRCQAGLRRRIDVTRLSMRDHTYLYAPMEDGTPARFGRRAAMRLAEGWIEPVGDGFALVLGQQRIPLRALAEAVAPPGGRR